MFYLVCGLSISMYFIYNLILNITLVYALIIANLTIQVKLIEYSLIICCIKKRNKLTYSKFLKKIEKYKMNWM